ncbi:hypothetical protein MMC30_008503 [Trapelia coarctata]|nr:hypothetical protein [Trapelia coarctata]
MAQGAEKVLGPTAKESNEPQQKSIEKTQDSDGEVVADLQSSSEDRRANKDKVSSPLRFASSGRERNRIEALQNHDCEIAADPQSRLEDRQASGDTSLRPPPSTPYGREGDRMEASQQTVNEAVEDLQNALEDPQSDKISPTHSLPTIPPFRQLAGEPPRSTTGPAEDTAASFPESIERAKQLLNEAVMGNDDMNTMSTEMAKSVAPNIKAVSWKVPWTQFGDIFLEVQRCCKLDGAFKSTLPTDSLGRRTRPLPKSQAPQAELLSFNIKNKGLFLEIHRETTRIISDGPLTGEFPNQASISNQVGQLPPDSTAEQYWEHFLVQAEGSHLKKLDYFTDLNVNTPHYPVSASLFSGLSGVGVCLIHSKLVN